MNNFFCYLIVLSMFPYVFATATVDDVVAGLEKEIIENIIKYHATEEGDSAQTRGNCLFQTQITQFNIPFVINTPGLYCIYAQTTLSTLQTGQNVTQNTTTNNAITPITFPSFQTTQLTFQNGHLVPTNQIVTQQQNTTLQQQALGAQNITVNDIAARAITVNSNDVIIDLNDNEIIGVGTTNTSGIIVNGRSNIIIRNGTIRNMTSNGINILNNNTTGQTTKNLLIHDVTFNNNRTGITMRSVTDGILLRNEAYLCLGAGFALTQNTNLIVDTCVSNNNNIGFSTLGNTALQFVNCSANSNTAAGFMNDFLVESEFADCTAQENQTGFIIEPNNGISSNITLLNNVAFGNTTHGFFISGNQISLEECQSKNNNNGFQIHGNNNVLLNCIGQGNTLNGIFLASAVSINSTSSNSQIRNNTLTSNNIGINNAGVNNHIYANFASNNKGGDFVGVPNVAISPTILTPINFTANIAE